jgi:hypothetical protein
VLAKLKELLPTSRAALQTRCALASPPCLTSDRAISMEEPEFFTKLLAKLYNEAPSLAHAIVDVEPRLVHILAGLLNGYLADNLAAKR